MLQAKAFTISSSLGAIGYFIGVAILFMDSSDAQDELFRKYFTGLHAELDKMEGELQGVDDRITSSAAIQMYIQRRAEVMNVQVALTEYSAHPHELPAVAVLSGQCTAGAPLEFLSTLADQVTPDGRFYTPRSAATHYR